MGLTGEGTGSDADRGCAPSSGAPASAVLACPHATGGNAFGVAGRSEAQWAEAASVGSYPLAKPCSGEHEGTAEC